MVLPGRPRTRWEARPADPASSEGTSPQSRGSSCQSRTACARRSNHFVCCATAQVVHNLSGQLESSAVLVRTTCPSPAPTQRGSASGPHTPPSPCHTTVTSMHASQNRCPGAGESGCGAPLWDTVLVEQQLVVRHAFLLQRQHRPVRERTCRVAYKEVNINVGPGCSVRRCKCRDSHAQPGNLRDLNWQRNQSPLDWDDWQNNVCKIVCGALAAPLSSSQANQWCMCSSYNVLHFWWASQGRSQSPSSPFSGDPLT